MSEPKRVSFKNVGGSAESPVLDANTGKPEVAATPAADVSAALAPRDESTVATPPSHSHFGGEDETDAADIRFPYLNLVQPTSASPLKEHGTGNFVLNKDTSLGKEFRAIFVGFSAHRYEEKVKYKGDKKARIFNSIDEVHAAGGTTRWFDSKENDKGNSVKPYFDTKRTALLLIEKPDGVAEDRFTELLDGKQYAVALFVVKGMAYESVYVALNSEQKTGLLKAGFYTRAVKMTVGSASKTSEAVKPIASVQEPIGNEAKAKALKLRS